MNDLPLGLAPEHRVLRLTRDEPLRACYGESALNLPRSPFAESDVAGFALAHDVAQCVHRFGYWRCGVVSMALIKIDIVHAQALQRRIDLLENLRARQSLILRAHRKIHLGRQHVRAAWPLRENLSQEALCGAASVGIGGIDKIDAEVESAVDAGNGVIAFAPYAICQPRTQ